MNKLFRLSAYLLLFVLSFGAWASVQVSNGVYTVSIADVSNTSFRGSWTAATGASHPTGAGHDLLYSEFGGSFYEGTNFSSLRSYTSGLDYSHSDFNPFFIGEGPSPLAPPGQGWTQTWVIPAENLTITQDVLVSGSGFSDSAIYHTVLLENTGDAPVLLGWRNLYDWQVDDPTTDDGPNNSIETTSGVTVATTTTEFEYVPAGDEFVRVSIDPGVPSYQSLLGIGYDPGFIPGLPVTTPDAYAYASWPLSVGTEFDYTTSPINVTSDSAGLSWFGKTINSAISLSPGESIRLTQVMFGVIPDEPPPGGDFSKMLTGGPDENQDGEVDLVIPTNLPTSTAYSWKINWSQAGSPDVLIADTAPAESIVNAINGDGTGLPIDCGEDAAFDDASGHTDLYRGGKAGKNCHSSTQIEWTPGSDSEELVVDVSMRESPGKGHKLPTFAPTSCGALYLNYGAAAYEIDPATGEPFVDGLGELLPPLMETDALCIAAVTDIDGDGILDYTGAGDEDGDGLTDYQEACDIGTDPCIGDSDGDGVIDGADECPLEGDMGLGVDAVGCPNTCDNYLGLACPPDIDGLYVFMWGGFTNYDPPCPAVFSSTWDWGDGNVDQFFQLPDGYVYPFPNDHTYAAPGTYLIDVRIFDADGAEMDQSDCEVTVP